MPPDKALPSVSLKACVVVLLLMALSLSCMALTAVGTWVQSPSFRGVLGTIILLYMFVLVGTLAVLDWLKPKRWAWFLAAAVAILPLGSLFAIYGSPMYPRAMPASHP